MNLTNPPPGLAFDENCALVRFTEFDYGNLDINSNGDHDGMDAEAVAVKVAQVYVEVQRWIFQNGKNHPEGLLIRSKIACWHLIPEVEDSYTLTSLAGEEGKAKQSFGRWQDDFRKRFPTLCNRHHQ